MVKEKLKIASRTLPSYSDKGMLLRKRAEQLLGGKSRWNRYWWVRHGATLSIALLAILTHSKVLAGLFILLTIVQVAVRGYLFVTRLRIFEKIFKPRRIHLTAGGWIIIILAILLGVAALNTGANLLYLVFSMVLSFIIVSGMLSEVTFRGIRVERSLPSAVFADEEFEVTLYVENRKRFLPSFSLWVLDAPGALILARGEQGALVVRVAAGRKVSVSYKARIKRRGVFTFKNFLISSSFPFNFFIKKQIFRGEDSIVVYPQIEKLDPQKVRLSLSYAAALRRALPTAPGDEEFCGLKEYRPGDNPRRIHWVSSARHRKLMVKEFEKQRANRVTVILDSCLSLPTEQKLLQFEQTVTFTASLIAMLTGLNYNIAFYTYLPRLAKIKGASGRRHFYRIMDTLARVTTSDKSIDSLTNRLDGSQLRSSSVYLVAIKQTPRIERATANLRKFTPALQIIDTSEPVMERFQTTDRMS